MESLSVQGCIVPVNGTILLKPVKKSKNIRDGFLRVHNMSNQAQTIHNFHSMVPVSSTAGKTMDIAGLKTVPVMWLCSCAGKKSIYCHWSTAQNCGVDVL